MAKVGDIISIPMTPQQFQDALEELDTPGNGITVNQALTPSTGHIATSQIAFDYAFNGLDTIALKITEEHGFAVSLASDDTVKARLIKMLAQHTSTEHLT